MSPTSPQILRGATARLLSTFRQRWSAATVPSVCRANKRPFQNLATKPIFSLMAGDGPSQPVAPLVSATGSSSARISTTSGEHGRYRKGEMGLVELSPTSILKIQMGDITVWSVDGTSDAIVNAANERMLGGGGVDGAIHRAAGPELKVACQDVPEVQPGVRCPTGEARITPAFRLPVSHVIHTVGPVYDEDDQPEVSLRNSYRNCLKLAKENGIQYIAFPAISCGVYRYPYDEASRIAISAVKEFSDEFKEVHFVLFSDDIYKAWLTSAQELI